MRIRKFEAVLALLLREISCIENGNTTLQNLVRSTSGYLIHRNTNDKQTNLYRLEIRVVNILYTCTVYLYFLPKSAFA